MEPYVVIRGVTLYHGDCLEIMPKLDVKFDCCITDPPYGTTSCPWDSVIPFPEMWEQLRRLVGGNCILFGSQPFSSLLVGSNVKDFKEELVWLKNKSASGFGKDTKHIKIHENILVFNFGKKTFNPEKWLVDRREFLVQRRVFNQAYTGNSVYGEIYDRVRKQDVGDRYPLSVVSCRVPFTPQKRIDNYNHQDMRYHPTQKPLDLLEYLIKTYSNEGQCILDFAAGSGTTGVASMEMKRKAVLIEKEQKYCEVARKRLEQKDKEMSERLF